MEQKEQLIHSLTHYAMGDIKHNEERPIAAFILGTCLVDTLAYYRYGNDSSLARFVDDYMPMFDGDDFVESFKRRLLPFYSLNGSRYSIGWGDRDKEENQLPDTIHVTDFIENVQTALDEFVYDLNSGIFNIDEPLSEHPAIKDKSNN